MSNVIVLPGQTLTDVAIQHTGTAESIYQIAADNGLSVFDPIDAGSELAVNVTTPDERTQRFYEERILSPASNIDVPTRDGIGVWIIGSTFIIQ